MINQQGFIDPAFSRIDDSHRVAIAEERLTRLLDEQSLAISDEPTIPDEEEYEDDGF